MTNEIEKPESPSPDDVLAAITSFNDPSIIVNIFKELGWTYSFEIKEWLMMARQNANLAVKSKALIQLRKLLREAAESSGLVANVSQTFPNAQGGHTTFHAKRIAGILNPAKKIKSTQIEECKDDKKEIRTEPNRDSNRGQSQGGFQTETPGTDTGDAFPSSEGCPGATNNSGRDVESGGAKPTDGGETPRPVPGGINNGTSSADNDKDSGYSNPCISTRPPTCDRDLFPGITSAGD